MRGCEARHLPAVAVVHFALSVLGVLFGLVAVAIDPLRRWRRPSTS